MEGYQIIYKKNKRAKNLSVRIASENFFLVTVPKNIPIIMAKGMLAGKESLFTSLIKRREEKKRTYEKSGYDISPDLFFVHTKEEIKELQERALHEVERLLSLSLVTFETNYSKVFIKNLKTRWGSCSSKGVLTFHYKILFLPEELKEYLVVHELAHLKEMNHGKEFWKLVEDHISFYKEKASFMRKLSFF